MTPSAFLTELFDGCPTTEWLSIFALDRTKGAQNVWWYRLDDLERLDEHVGGILRNQCVWFSAATRREKLTMGRGAATDCAHIPSLWLDVDVAGPGHKTTKRLPPDKIAARALIDDYHISPTHVIDSGHGLQAYFKLDKPLVAEEAKPVLDRWGDGWKALATARGWHIDSVWDVARVLRLPFTYNTKRVD